MKVLMINGSPKLNGNTAIALNEMKMTFEAGGRRWSCSTSATRIFGAVSPVAGARRRGNVSSASTDPIG